jgi:chromosome segregation ATPase
VRVGLEAFNINSCQNAQLRHENEYLKKENERLLVENKALRLLAEELAILKPIHAALVAKCEQLEKDLATEKDHNDMLHRRLTTTMDSLERANNDNIQLRVEVEELTLLAKELEELKVEHAALVKHSAELERSLAALTAEHEALLRRCEEMAARIASLEADLDEERRLHTALKAEHAELVALKERMIKQYKEYTDQWNEEIVVLRRECSSLTKLVFRPQRVLTRISPHEHHSMNDFLGVMHSRQ